MGLELWPWGLAALAIVLLGYGALRLHALSQDESLGRWVGVDDPVRPSVPLRSERWGLVGRPDELRRLPDGRVVPVEWKSRPAPSRGPYRSHRVQLLAYLALVEESTGRSPPFGVLRYGDGVEFRIAWDAGARAELWEVRSAAAAPYDGRSLGSPAKCAGCRWREICDVRSS